MPHKSIFIFFTGYKLHFLTIISFIAYLLTLPFIIQELVPCLKRIPGSAYSWDECHVTLALDWYIWLALGGLALMIIFIFIKSAIGNKIKPVSLTGGVLALLIIIAYHLYIPQIEKVIIRAPMILNTDK